MLHDNYSTFYTKINKLFEVLNFGVSGHPKKKKKVEQAKPTNDFNVYFCYEVWLGAKVIFLLV